MKKPLLSIAVPTKNRYVYLYSLIKLIDSFKSEDIELVIQDNSDDNSEILAFMQYHKYEWLVYNHTQGQIAMSLNSDLSIKNSSGEYICFLGDDDGVVIDIIEYVKYMRNKGIEVAMPNSVMYYWPEVGKSRFLQMGGRVVYDKPSKSEKIIRGYDALKACMDKGFINRGQMPMVYHAIVKRELLDKVYEKAGSYFPGNSPDISNAVAMSLVTDQVVQTKRLLTISGASKYHGGGAGLVKRKHPELSDFPWFIPKAAETWDSRVPKVGEGECIWCDSAIRALKNMGREDLIDSINFTYLHAYFSASYRDIWKMGLEKTKSIIMFYVYLIIFTVERVFSGMRSMLFAKFDKIPKKITAISYYNIIEVSQYLHNINKKL